MDLKEVRDNARKKMKGCHVCPDCNGKACIGMIPGFGGLRTARSFMRKQNCVVYTSDAPDQVLI